MKLPFTKVALKNLFSKPSTLNYPAEDHPAQPNYRGRIAYDPEKCKNCGMCIKVCSPSAITRAEEEVEGGKKVTYEFDLTSCTFCGTCADFCDGKAITMTGDYHMVAEKRADLRVVGSSIKKAPKGKLAIGDDCVYCGLCARTCPEGAITVDRATKTWTVDENKCKKCGLCISKCPKKTLAFQEPAPEVVTKNDDCVYCTLCAKKCPVGAITVDRAAKTWTIDKEACIHCGSCISGCPKKALSFQPECAAAPAPKAEPASAPAPAAPAEDEVVTKNDNCVYCTLCALKCPVKAIKVDRAAKTWELDEEACIKCGTCVNVCAKKALSFEKKQ